MYFHPSIHLEIARQRQHDLLAKAERHRLANAALAGRQEHRARSLPQLPHLHKPSPAAKADHPRQANA
jgi:hypothetical protein